MASECIPKSILMGRTNRCSAMAASSSTGLRSGGLVRVSEHSPVLAKWNWTETNKIDINCIVTSRHEAVSSVEKITLWHPELHFVQVPPNSTRTMNDILAYIETTWDSRDYRNPEEIRSLGITRQHSDSAGPLPSQQIRRHS